MASSSHTGRPLYKRGSIGLPGSVAGVRVWTRFSGKPLELYHLQNVQCVRETEILVEQQPPQEVLVCDRAGLVINKFSPAGKCPQLLHGGDSTATQLPVGLGQCRTVSWASTERSHGLSQ